MSNKQKERITTVLYGSTVFGINLLPRAGGRHVLMQLCQHISVSDGTSYWEEIGTFSSAWLNGIQSTFRSLENHLNNSGDFQVDGAGYLFKEKVEDDNSEKQATINKLISELGKQNQLYALSRGDLESTAFHIAKIQEKEAALLKVINS